MFRSVLKTALSAIAFAGLISTANAQVVSIQLQEAGFPTVFIGSGTSTAHFSGNFGTFFISSLDAAAASVNNGFLLNSHTINSSSDAGGTLTILITATGLHTANSEITAHFSEISVEGSATIQEAVFLDPANVPFSMAVPLGSDTFTASGHSKQRNIIPLALPFSLTAEYVITAVGAATSNSMIAVTVPEPSSWALMLLGFAGLGFAFRQSRRELLELTAC
jgi:hypothetical protein